MVKNKIRNDVKLALISIFKSYELKISQEKEIYLVRIKHGQIGRERIVIVLYRIVCLLTVRHRTKSYQIQSSI